MTNKERIKVNVARKFIETKGLSFESPLDDDFKKKLIETTIEETEKEYEEKLKQIVYGEIDWIKVFQDAYEQRKTSWKKLGEIQEWRNATDEVMIAFWKQFESKLKKEILENS